MENKTFDQLWEDFRIKNPNSIGAFQDQYESFKWLYDRLKVTEDASVCMKNNNLTAVEWLVKIYLQTKKIDSFDIEQAKQKENEQRKQDLKTGYNIGYLDAQANHINDADNFAHEYLNH